MNERQALTKARSLLGSRAFVTWNPRAPDEDEKAAQRERWLRLRETQLQAEAARDALRAELLSDPRYVALLKTARAAVKASEAARPTSRSRVEIGRDNSIFRTVEYSGDSFDQAFAMLEAKRAKAGAP